MRHILRSRVYFSWWRVLRRVYPLDVRIHCILILLLDLVTLPKKVWFHGGPQPSVTLSESRLLGMLEATSGPIGELTLGPQERYRYQQRR